MAVYIKMYYQYKFLHDKEKIISVPLNLKTNLSRRVCQNIDQHTVGKWLIQGPKHWKDN